MPLSGRKILIAEDELVTTIRELLAS